MGKRATGRRLAMKILYQADIKKEETINDVVSSFFEDADYLPETVSFATDLAQQTWSHLSELDSVISQRSEGWEMSRITPVDRNILRLSLYELLHTHTDASVIINEAVEMAKKYSTDDSPKFINGILGHFIESM